MGFRVWRFFGCDLYQRRLLMPDFGTFVLRYFQDLSIKEIASIVDIPEGTVKSLLSNGLKELRKLMKDGVRGDENL